MTARAWLNRRCDSAATGACTALPGATPHTQGVRLRAEGLTMDWELEPGMVGRRSADHDHGGRVHATDPADGRRDGRRHHRKEDRRNDRRYGRTNASGKHRGKRAARHMRQASAHAVRRNGGCGCGKAGERREIGHPQRLPTAPFPVKNLKRRYAAAPRPCRARRPRGR